MQDPNILVLDARSYDAFSSQHIPGAWHIDFGSNMDHDTSMIICDPASSGRLPIRS